MIKLIEVRLHGRGGQGAVTAAELLAKAAFEEGLYAQSFPFFGIERRGAPVMAFLRLDQNPISLHTNVYKPDVVVCLDAKLVKEPFIIEGVKKGGIIILNTSKRPEKIDLGIKFAKIGTVNATEIAFNLFGIRTIPTTNTALMGAFAATTGLVKLESIVHVISKRWLGDLGERNIKAATLAFEQTKVSEFEVDEQSYKKLELTEEPVEVEAPFPPLLWEIGGLKTGSWRTYKPEILLEKCNKCGRCFQVCPEGLIYEAPEGVEINLNYCKGCGICAEACRRNAIEMVSDFE